MADLNNSLLRVTEGLKSIFGQNSTVPGSKLYQLGESIAYESYIIADTVDNHIYENSLATSTGKKLTNIGNNFFGIDRIHAKIPKIDSTMKAIKFYTNNGVAFGNLNRVNGINTDIVVYEGTLISGQHNNTNYVFRVTEDTVLNSLSREAYVSAELVNGDTELIPSNILTNHDCKTYATAASNFLLVTNPVAIGLSSPEEDDNNYRYRLTKAFQGRELTSFYGIRNKLLQLPGVSNIEIIPSAYGGGTFTVIVQGMTPITSDDLIEIVRSSVDSIVPPWVYYTIEKPNYIGITMDITLDMSLGNAVPNPVVQNMQRAISDYVNNFYGAEFNTATIQSIAQNAIPSQYVVNLDSVQVYTGYGDMRMFEELNLDSSDRTIYMTNLDKIVIEPDIYQPIKVQVVE